jgi:hypothetical protein
LKSDKKLVLFPMVSGVGALLVLLSFGIPMWVLAAKGIIQRDASGHWPVWIYAVIFAFYFCNYFVIVFCNAALISCALMHFNGEEPTLSDGFRAATARLPQILAWALVSATVGLLLKLIENANEKVGQIVSALLGTAWTITTYFVVPVLVVEKIGPVEAIRRSLQLLRKAWGEALVGGIGLGLFKFLLFLPGFLLFGLGIVLCGAHAVFLGMLAIGLALVYMLLFGAVSAALDSIFLAALYQYAAFQRVPSGFDSSNLEGAFRKK